MFCLAPLVLVGYMFTIQAPWHHTTKLDGAMIEVQSCEAGLGFDVKVSSTGLYGAGLQYGMKTNLGDDFTLTILPKAGISYVDHPVYELPQRTQFEVGAQLLFGHKDSGFRMGVEYWHLSNAGMTKPNIGLDMLILQTGWRF